MLVSYPAACIQERAGGAMAAADGGGEDDGGIAALLGVAGCVVEQPTTIETRRMLATLAVPLAIKPHP